MRIDWNDLEMKKPRHVRRAERVGEVLAYLIVGGVLIVGVWFVALFMQALQNIVTAAGG